MEARELTYREAARILGVHPKTVAREACAGRLMVRRYGYRTVRVPMEALRRYQNRKTARALT